MNNDKELEMLSNTVIGLNLQQAVIHVEHCQTLSSLIGCHNDKHEDPYTTKIGLEIMNHLLERISSSLGAAHQELDKEQIILQHK